MSVMNCSWTTSFPSRAQSACASLSCIRRVTDGMKAKGCTLLPSVLPSAFSRTRKRTSIRWPTGNRSTTKHGVVLVQFPFDDLSSARVRPAVCLTEPIGPHQHLILAFVTSRIPASPLKTDLVIDAGGADFAATGLRVSSTLQLHRLMTVIRVLLHRELGALSPPMQAQVQERLRELFELG